MRLDFFAKPFQIATIYSLARHLPLRVIAKIRRINEQRKKSRTEK